MQHSKADGTADLAETLNRSVDQVRAKKNSLFTQLKKAGVQLPSLKRQERSGMAYAEAANVAQDYINSLMSNSDSQSEE